MGRVFPGLQGAVWRDANGMHLGCKWLQVGCNRLHLGCICGSVQPNAAHEPHKTDPRQAPPIRRTLMETRMVQKRVQQRRIPL